MTITARSLTHYQVEITAGNHQFTSDEPLGIGDDAGPSPFDLLLSGLGSCIVITLHMYANRKNWPLQRVTVELDIRSGEPREDGKPVSIIEKRLAFEGELSPGQIDRLVEISDRCPVSKVLVGEIQIQTSVKQG